MQTYHVKAGGIHYEDATGWIIIGYNDFKNLEWCEWDVNIISYCSGCTRYSDKWNVFETFNTREEALEYYKNHCKKMIHNKNIVIAPYHNFNCNSF